MLPLTMIIATLILSLIIHGIFLLDSERRFLRSADAVFQLRQLRENAFSELGQAIKKNALPESGRYTYEGAGTATFTLTSDGAQKVIHVLLETSHGSQTDQVVFDSETAVIIRWQEAVNP
jgi:hypothetical protein